MNLIIVESPTKAKTLAKFLGSEYQIEASMGHLRDLPQSKFGVDVEHNFTPEYVISKGKEEKAKELKNYAKKATKIILATDPDREGEAIAWHLESIIHNTGLAARQAKYIIQRITFHEITEGAIKEALSKPGEINMQLVDAQQARRILDRLVGYKLSPLLWRKIRKGLSAGRVQSVAVRLIVEREREILAFKPEEYWEIHAQLQGTSSLEAILIKTEIKNKDEADKIVQNLNGSEFKVQSVETKEVKRNPYPPFTTSTLQQTASNLFGWSAKRTMQIAQNLYEHGFITYHRTDSTNLATEAITNARNFISKTYGEKYLPNEPKLYKVKSKVAQEAHEAIRPTAAGNIQDTRNNNQLDHDQKRLYELIWKRFIACQMTEAIYEQTSVDVIAIPPQRERQSYIFRANGNKQIFDGYQKLYARPAPGEAGEREEGVVLPELIVGQVLELLNLTPSQHFTDPPPRYNEASLIKILEEYGIGRPSTYAPIISTIQERQYVEKQEKRFFATNLGMAVNDFLMANFPNIIDYKFTAGMEGDLDAIANGEKQWVPVISDFYTPFEEQLKTVGNTVERVKVEVEESDEICPIDGSPLVIRIGKFGRFLACSKFPDCKFTKPFQKKIDIKCPKCQTGDVIIRKTRSKKTFFGCSRYPDCDFASWTRPTSPGQSHGGRAKPKPASIV